MDRTKRRVFVMTLVVGLLAVMAPAAAAEATANDLVQAVEDDLHSLNEQTAANRWAEAWVTLETLRTHLRTSHEPLVEEAGEIAQKELEEIDEFVERLEKAVDAKDTASVGQIVGLIRHEIEEIQESLTGRYEGAVVEVEVDKDPVRLGQTLTTTLVVEHLDRPLGAFSIVLSFDPQALQAESAEVMYGSGIKRLDNAAGHVSLQAFKAQDGSTGDVAVARIVFRAIQSGESDLGIRVDDLAETDGTALVVAGLSGADVHVEEE